MELRFFSPGPVRVKVCGVTQKDDALAAIDAGADALGFNFWPGSKRALVFDLAADWIAQLPRDVARVAVVVNADESLLELLHGSGLFDAIQFHGDETPGQCLFGHWNRWIRAVRVAGPRDLNETLEYQTPWILADAASAPGVYGGSGKSVDREIVRDFVRAQPDRKIILAGGLTPENVASAIRTVRPFAVDVASGVESSPGKKDTARMRAFVAEVRRAQAKT